MPDVPSVREDIPSELWPDEMVEADARVWHRLTQDQRDKARLRITAIRGLSRRSDIVPSFENAAQAAAYAGMGVSTFYAMLKRWSARPGLAAVGVGAAEPDMSGVGESAMPAAETFLAGLLGAEDYGTQELIRRLSQAGFVMSKTSAIRLIRKVRRGLPITLPFGEHVAIDSAGMDMTEGYGHRVRLHCVLDVGSGIVLGWKIIPEGTGLEAYRSVAQAAIATLPDFTPIGLQAADHTELEARFPPGDIAANHLLHGRLRLAGKFTATADRETGTRVIRALGDRVAGVWLGVGQRLDDRSYRTGRPDRMPTVSEGLISEIGEWLDDHNLRRLALIPDGGAVGPPAELTSVRARLMEVVETVDADERGRDEWRLAQEAMMTGTD